MQFIHVLCCFQLMIWKRLVTVAKLPKALYFRSVPLPTGDSRSTSGKQLRLPAGVPEAVHPKSALMRSGRPLIIGIIAKCLFQVDLGCPQEFCSHFMYTSAAHLMNIRRVFLLFWFGWGKCKGQINVPFNSALTLYANRKNEDSS